jgi:hypothetical protein
VRRDFLGRHVLCLGRLKKTGKNYRSKIDIENEMDVAVSKILPRFEALHHYKEAQQSH